MFNIFRLLGLKPNKKQKAETQDYSARHIANANVVRSAFHNRLFVSSLITVVILVSLIFYDVPKWLAFILIIVLVCQPLLIVFTNDHNKCK
jgi:ABC-type bacteriocin/lantibiotic exporter with double-glycine peptidase domain